MVQFKVPRVADVKKNVDGQVEELQAELDFIVDTTLARWAYDDEEWYLLLRKKMILRKKIKELSKK